MGRTPDTDTIVVNIGDMLQRLTNDVYPSTTHRVVNPPGERARHVASTITPDNPKCYPSRSHPGYPEERLREIRLP